MSELSTKVDRLTELIDRLDSRLQRIESNPEFSRFGTCSDIEEDKPNNFAKHGHEQKDLTGPTHFQGTASRVPVLEIQQEFRAIRRSLESVRLPADQQINCTRSGISRNNQPVYNVISSCAQYTETALKWVGLHKPGECTEDELLSLHTVLLAQIRYLQSEYQALLVTTHFDRDTASFFRQLQSDNSNFTDTALQNLRTAAEVSAIKFRQPQDRGKSFASRGRGYRRGGPRGSWSYGQRDAFQHFANRGASHTPGGAPIED